MSKHHHCTKNGCAINESLKACAAQASPSLVSPEQAMYVASCLGIDFTKSAFDLEQFRRGMEVELEHGLANPLTNVTNNDPILTGKIALAHLNEFPDYYTRLAKMEAQARRYWDLKRAR